jgi:hypothetical protein
MTVFKRRKSIGGINVDFAAISSSGIPYLWGSGDISSSPSIAQILTRPGGNVSNARLGSSSYVTIGSQGLAIGGGVIVSRNVNSNVNGEVYVWDYTGNLLGLSGTGIIPSPVPNIRFGCNVSVSTAGKIVISAQNGNRGSVYLYDRFGTQLGFIDGPFTNGRFGKATAIGCGKIVVGRPEGRGTNDTQFTNAVGEIRIYDNYTLNTSDVNFNETTVVIPEQFANEGDTSVSSFCGTQVDIGCGRIIASATGARVSGLTTGVVYLLDLSGNVIKRITPPDPQSGQNFGVSIAIGCGLIVIGSPFYNQTAGGSQGAVYVYDLDGNFIFEISGTTIADSLGQWVSVGSGRIVASSPQTSGGLVSVFDLDGNLIQNRFNQGNLTGDEFGSCHKIRDGRLLIGAPGTNNGSPQNGNLYRYESADVYTLYDAVDLKYG